MKLSKLTLILLLILSFKSFSQDSPKQEPVKMFIGNNDKAVRGYFESLINLFPDNQYLKIEETTTDRGDLFLKLILPMMGENKSGCLTIFAVFHRSGGDEICVRQAVMGSDISAYRNLIYVRDNYKSDGDNKWIAPIYNSKGEVMPNFFVVATYEKQESTYTMAYDFKFVKDGQ